MKPDVTFKYLSYLRNQKNQQQEGFTLIELLVVVIIIGILAAVALPNLLGQVGKARETEGKNAVGSINRAQQVYHFEKGTFSNGFNNTQLQTVNSLDIMIPASKYYNFSVISTGSTDFASVTAQGIPSLGATTPDNGAAQGTRDYVGGTAFDGKGAYGVIICQADKSGTANATTITSGVITLGNTVGSGCATGDTEIK